MQRLIFLFSQFIRIVLIAYVALVGPLVYLKPHSPHKIDAPAYRLTIFADAQRGLVLAELRQRLQKAEISLPITSPWDNPQPALREQAAILVLDYGLQGALGHIYLGADAPRLDIPLCPFPQDWTSPLAKHSLDLPPPDRPPSF